MNNVIGVFTLWCSIRQTTGGIKKIYIYNYSGNLLLNHRAQTLKKCTVVHYLVRAAHICAFDEIKSEVILCHMQKRVPKFLSESYIFNVGLIYKKV